MGQRLLIVDSDRRFIADHQIALESSFDVDYQTAAEGVLEALESGRYAAVLLSAEVSENKGYALCSAIRRQPSLAELKIILISSKATEEEYARHQTLRGRADAYLRKPLETHALIATLSGFVPPRSVDPDNPLGDLAGADLGEEWLDSLRAEVEQEPPPPHPAPAPPVAPALPRVPAVALPSIPAPEAARDAGKLELMEARIKDLETKLQAQGGELEAKEKELSDFHAAQDRATRNLEEALQCRMELGELQQKLSDSEEALVAQEARASKAEAASSHLQDKLEDLERALEEARGAAEQAQRATEAQGGAKAELEARLGEQDQELARLREELAAAGKAAARIDELQGTATAHATRVQELEALVGERESEFDRLRQQAEIAEAASAQLAELQASASAHAARVQELEGQVDEARQEIAERSQEGEALKVDLAGLEATLRGQRRELAEQAGRLGSLTRECEAMLNRAGAAEGRCAELEASLKERDDLLETARAEAAELRELRARMEAELADKEALLVSTCEARDARIEELDRAHAEEAQALREEAAGFSGQVEKLTMELAQRQEELGQLVAGHESQRMELMQGIDEREAQIGRLNGSLDALQQQVAELERGKRELEGHLNEKAARLESLNEVLAGLHDGLRRASDLTRPV